MDIPDSIFNLIISFLQDHGHLTRFGGSSIWLGQNQCCFRGRGSDQWPTTSVPPTSILWTKPTGWLNLLTTLNDWLAYQSNIPLLPSLILSRFGLIKNNLCLNPSKTREMIITKMGKVRLSPTLLELNLWISLGLLSLMTYERPTMWITYSHRAHSPCMLSDSECSGHMGSQQQLTRSPGRLLSPGSCNSVCLTTCVCVCTVHTDHEISTHKKTWSAHECSFLCTYLWCHGPKSVVCRNMH